MAPEWKSSRGGQGPGRVTAREWRRPGFSTSHEKTHLTRNQEPEYAMIWRRTQGGRGEDTGDTNGAAIGENPRCL